VLAVALFGTPCASAQDVQPNPPPLDDQALMKKYVWSTLGPTGLLTSALWAGFDEWTDSPASWTREERGYLQRWASEYGAAAIGSTTKYTVAHFLHEDPSFVRCNCTGVGPRLRHAMTAPFMARTSDGEWVFSPATVAGIAAENVIPAATWYPEPRGAREGAAHVVSGVLSKMAVDVAREFLPKRLLHRPGQ
jgi:hypothetical protein